SSLIRMKDTVWSDTSISFTALPVQKYPGNGSVVWTDKECDLTIRNYHENTSLTVPKAIKFVSDNNKPAIIRIIDGLQTGTQNLVQVDGENFGSAPKIEIVNRTKTINVQP